MLIHIHAHVHVIQKGIHTLHITLCEGCWPVNLKLYFKFSVCSFQEPVTFGKQKAIWTPIMSVTELKLSSKVII